MTNAYHHPHISGMIPQEAISEVFEMAAETESVHEAVNFVCSCWGNIDPDALERAVAEYVAEQAADYAIARAEWDR